MTDKSLVLLAFCMAAVGYAQTPIAYVPVEGTKISGALEVANGKAAIGTNGMITAGDRAVKITLPNRGDLQLCSTSVIHLAMDKSVVANGAGLLMALDRGAVEAHFSTGKYSDVLMTPDFRILISGPGTANLRLRVNAKGDTCLENYGENAPYVTVSSPFEEGVYRVQANQRVLFEHGSLRDVVDRERESCGCPASKPAGENSFPVAVSEGLAAPPTTTTTKVAPGETHTKVTAQLSYDGQTNKTSSVDAPEPPKPEITAEEVQVATSLSPKKKNSGGGFFHRLGHFFGHLFGA